MKIVYHISDSRITLDTVVPFGTMRILLGSGMCLFLDRKSVLNRIDYTTITAYKNGDIQFQYTVNTTHHEY